MLAEDQLQKSSENIQMDVPDGQEEHAENVAQVEGKDDTMDMTGDFMAEKEDHLAKGRHPDDNVDQMSDTEKKYADDIE